MADFTDMLTELVVWLNLADGDTTPIGRVDAERPAPPWKGLLRWN